jgi:probable F420-dependent oxidoreductase
MKVDLMTAGLPLRRMQEFARDVERAGFSGIVVTETSRTAYLSCAAAALATDLDLATGVALAFPRSPMITAQIAWELADASRGRFRLGLGTQVRAHIERRFASPFDPPGPRLREYVEALRAIFRAFRGEERLDFKGRYWSMSLLPHQFTPGPLDVADPPIDIAAVNPWMLGLAGELGVGVHVHPLNTRTYLASTLGPSIEAGARRAGRDPTEVALTVPCFTIVGDTDEERSRWRETVRRQVSFYGSTPNYAFIFEQLGAPDTTPRIRERQKAGDPEGMAAVVTDELLDHFSVTATWDGLADAVIDRYGGTASRVVFYFAGVDWDRDPGSLGQWGEVARDIVNRTG